MKKETVSRILLISLCSLVLIGFFAGVVSAATNNPVQQMQEIFTNMFSGNSAYDYFSSILSPQILFFILIFLVIYAIIDKIHIFGTNPWVSVTIAVIVAILSAGFIDPAWFLPLVNQYTALGILISLFLPFVLLFYFLKSVAPNNRIIQLFVWWVYFFIVLVNAITNWSKIPDWNGHWYSLGHILFALVLFLCLAMAIAGTKIFNMIFKEELKSALAERTQEAQAALVAEIAHDKRRINELEGAAKAALQRTIDRNQEALDKLK